MYKMMLNKFEFTIKCRQNTLMAVHFAASKKNDCATVSELLRPPTCEVQFDLYMAPIKGVGCIIENLSNINGH